MKKATVYFTDFRCSDSENLQQKFTRLLKTAGLGKIDLADKLVAIKTHFGEPGCLAYLRPNWAKTLADFVKAEGGHPFLTDANTLYVGRRKNALEHITSAYENGFSPFSTGCHVIIADGLRGTDDVVVPLPDGKYVKEAYIGRALMDADVVISLNHFKCHEMTGIGGALKNLGMGSGSRAGKMEQHCEGKPVVETERCIGCGSCVRICAHDGPRVVNGKASIDHAKCVGCGRCLAVCPKDAIEPSWAGSAAMLSCKIAEYAFAVVKDRPAFHISLICDVSPFCDCHAENDMPIIPDVGMLASFDPVALDQACVDLCNKMPVLEGSRLDKHIKSFWDADPNHEYFHLNHPDAEWEAGLIHAEEIGLGSRQYELVKI